MPLARSAAELALGAADDLRDTVEVSVADGGVTDHRDLPMKPLDGLACRPSTLNRFGIRAVSASCRVLTISSADAPTVHPALAPIITVQTSYTGCRSKVAVKLDRVMPNGAVNSSRQNTAALRPSKKISQA